MANVLKHIIGKETKIVVLEGDKVELDDFFSAQYKKALSITESIVKNQGGNTDKTAQVENYNNIISFIGERGSGKTSCMLTFANILEAQGKDELKNKNQSLSSDELSNKGFYQLPTIDPSFFAKEYNIIGAFIASIYNKFQELTQKNNNNSDDGVIQDFYNALSNAQRSFGKIYTEGKPGIDDMERLEQMSCRLKLKSEIKTLVDSFLCYISNRNDKKNATKLVLCIDDIDLNTETAVEMMEWIRKYLIQPNIIILFAIKLDQMVDLKRLKLYGEYKALLDKDKSFALEIDDMVEKYITKIMPLQHRVLMPDFEDVSNIRYYKLTEQEAKDIDADPTKSIKEDDLPWLRDEVVKRIFQKTRYLFYNQATSTSLIVPRNLREVLHLMSMLETMPEIKGNTKPEGENDDDREKTLRTNQDLFKEYVFNDCNLKYLTSESREWIDELLEVSEAKYFNSKVIYILKNKFKIGDNDFKEVKDDEDEDSNEIPLSQITKAVKTILNKDNIAYNISTGDVLWILNWLGEMQRTKEELYFLFVVRFIYSIRMYECYDQMFTIDLKDISKDEEEGKIAYTRPKTELKEVSDYQQLIAGQLFNPSLVNFIPEGKAKWFTDGVINWKKVKDEKLYENEENYKLIEFLMLCTSGPVLNNDTVRRRSMVTYGYTFGSGTQKTKFDLYSFFYNIVDIKSCYKRFETLFDKGRIDRILSNVEKTLWSDFYRVALDTTCWNLAKGQSGYSGLRENEYRKDKQVKKTVQEGNEKQVVNNEQVSNEQQAMADKSKTDETTVDTQVPKETRLSFNLDAFITELKERRKSITKDTEFKCMKGEEQSIKFSIDSKEWSHLWRSWCSIRNAEVYQDFVNYLEGNRNQSANADLYKKIESFFDSVFYYNQATHDYKNDGDKTFYKLNFAFVGCMFTMTNQKMSLLFGENIKEFIMNDEQFKVYNMNEIFSQVVGLITSYSEQIANYVFEEVPPRKKLTVDEIKDRIRKSDKIEKGFKSELINSLTEYEKKEMSKSAIKKWLQNKKSLDRQ